MFGTITRGCVLGVLVCATAGAAAAEEPPGRPRLINYSMAAGVSVGELSGVIEDDEGKPLAGAVVSAVGSATAFAVSNNEGRFVFRNLPAGPYLVRAHLQGYAAARGQVIQVTAGGRRSYTFALTRTAETTDPPPVLAAGVGIESTVEPEKTEKKEHGHDEVAWRLRHLSRGVLKEAERVAVDLGRDDSLFEDSLEGIGRAVGGPARAASAFFADFPFNGHLNLLTTTSFDRPQDLFMMGAEAPQGVAYLSLVAPGANGEWLVRGTITQGDISSWIVSGSYRRASDADHAYEAGLSYSAQQYVGGNGEALLAMQGSRNVGSVFAYDNWAVADRVRVGYGTRYARYDYLPDESLWSPRASVTLRPSSRDPLVVRAMLSHRETAPGAEEFTPPSAGLWLPPERTFSQISRAEFQPERLDHVEVAAEREGPAAVLLGVRVFRQRVQDQVITLFGLAPVEDARSGPGHYHVGSAGDFDARGWSVSASRSVGDGIRASIDYTQFASRWSRASSDAPALAAHAPSVLRRDERIHDMTAAVESVIAPSATRLYVLYKLNTGFATADETAQSVARNARFNVQVTQGLPFLTFMNANWEMLVAVTNLFRDEPLDSSVYDELFVVAPPKRVVGGVTMRF